MFYFTTIGFYTSMNFMTAPEPGAIFKFCLTTSFTVRLNVVGLFHIDCVCIGYYTKTL